MDMMILGLLTFTIVQHCVRAHQETIAVERSVRGAALSDLWILGG
jgi:hypothetical protein